MKKRDLAIALSLGLLSFTAAGAPLTTSQNSVLSVPASRLAKSGLPWATNLSGSNFILSLGSPVTQQGGKARLINSLEWAQRYSGATFGAAYDMALRADGSVVVVGPSDSFATKSDFATVCYAADGTALWTNRYDGPAHSDDIGRYVATNPSGEVWVVGESSREQTTHPSDVVLLKYTRDGVPAWTNRFVSFETNSSWTGGLKVDGSGNVYVAEQSAAWSGNTGTPIGAAITKFDPSGNIIWTKRYPDEGPDSGQGIFRPGQMLPDDAGNVVIAGSSGMPHYTSGDSIVKFASDGTAIWTNYRPRGISFGYNTLQRDRGGDFILTGDGWDGNTTVYGIMKCSSAGVTLWTNEVRGPLYSGAYVPQALPGVHGDVYFIGGSVGTSDGLYDIRKFDISGTPSWTNQAVHFGSPDGTFTSAATDGAGNLYLLGFARTPGQSDNDIVTMKCSGDGVAIWTNRFASSAGLNDIGLSLAVDDNGSVYVSGGSGIGSFITLRYSDTLVYTPPTGFTGVDTFTCVLTDRSGNSATGSVQVVVTPGIFQLSPTNLGLTPSGFRVVLSGLPSTKPVVFEASSDLISWEKIGTNTPSAGAVEFLDPFAPSLSRRFYRASQEP
jgi:hypothetical protein